MSTGKLASALALVVMALLPILADAENSSKQTVTLQQVKKAFVTQFCPTIASIAWDAASYRNKGYPPGTAFNLIYMSNIKNENIVYGFMSSDGRMVKAERTIISAVYFSNRFKNLSPEQIGHMTFDHCLKISKKP